MAGFATSSFNILCVPQNLIKGRHSKRSALCRIPSMAPRKTVSNLLALDITDTEISSVNLSHHRCLTATSMQLGCIAICNSVALAYAELLKLTWTTHDFLAFCHGKWVHPTR